MQHTVNMHAEFIGYFNARFIFSFKFNTFSCISDTKTEVFRSRRVKIGNFVHGINSFCESTFVFPKELGHEKSNSPFTAVPAGLCRRQLQAYFMFEIVKMHVNRHL